MYERNWEMDIYEDQSQPMSHKVNISFKKKNQCNTNIFEK